MRQEIINILISMPEMRNQREREQLLTNAGLSNFVTRIDLSGSTNLVASEVVTVLENYGSLETGEAALAKFLSHIRQLVGLEKQEIIDRIVNKQEVKNKNLIIDRFDRNKEKILQKNHLADRVSIENKPIQIFLAHASEDKETVKELYDRLKQQGYKPWLDIYDLLLGQKWREEIPRAIKNSDFIIICLSSISVEKQGYLQREFKLALNLAVEKTPGTIYLLPVRLDRCEVPDIQLVEFGENLRDYQWVNYYESDGFERLVNAIELQLNQSNPSATKLKLEVQKSPRSYTNSSDSNYSSDTENSEDVAKIINLYKRRLQILEEQQAIKGINTPPEIIIEIEDIERKIKNLQQNHDRVVQHNSRELAIVIERLTKENQQLLDLAKLAIEKPINVEATAVAGDQIHQSGNFGIGVNKGKVTADKIAGTINQNKTDNSRNINISGGIVNANGAEAFNLGDIHGTIANSISQIPEQLDPDRASIKELLQQLNQAIATDETLEQKTKDKLLKRIKNLADAAAQPKNEDLRDSAEDAIAFLRNNLPATAAAFTISNNLLPTITKIFGF